MTTLEIFEATAKKIPCLICLNSRFQVNLSCELPKSPCYFYAVFGHCQHKILITQNIETMQEVCLRIEQHINNEGCPGCGDHKLNLEFLCDVDSKDCFFLVKCLDNGHYSSLR
jgi:hypothetical protein